MPITNMQDLPINGFLRDDMLLKVTDSNPWYVNIVNFLVSGYVPPGENKKKLLYESRRHLWDNPYLYGYAQMAYSEDVYQKPKGSKSLRSATPHHMEATMVYFAPRRKYGKVVSTGHQCMRIPETSS